jgi:hypothetical protein
MKTMIIFLTLLITQYGNAQKTKEAQEDNLVKTYELKNTKSILIKNDKKNFTIKTWKNSSVKIATYINTDNKKELESYSFKTKQRGDVFKIEIDVEKDMSEDGATARAVSVNGDNVAVASADAKAAKNKNRTVTRNGNITYTNANNGYYNSYNNDNNNCSCSNLSEKVTITVPETMDIEIENNYGNVDIEDDLNTLKIDSKSGNINTQAIKNLTLESSYTNFELGTIEKATMEVNGCNFTLTDIENLDLDTKFSNFEIENIGTLNLESSQSDNFDLSNVGSVKGSFSFSTFKIQKLTQQLDLNANSGSIKVKNLAPTVTKINIEGKYSDVDLNAKNIPAYNLTAKTIFSTIRSNGKTWESNTELDEFKDSKGTGGKTAIYINCNSCTVVIK